MIKSEIKKPGTFLYFAYSGNLLEFRIHMHSPSAEFVSIARLDNYRLDFIEYCHFWGGPSGTLVATANAHVWGVIYRISCDDRVSLDDAKGVDRKRYYITNVKVLTPHMGMFNCRTYIKKVNPLPRGDKDPIPLEQWPSWTYQQVLVMGCEEHGVPEYYVSWLRSYPNNGEEGWLRAAVLLRRYAAGDRCNCDVPGLMPRIPLKLDTTNYKRSSRLEN